MATFYSMFVSALLAALVMSSSANIPANGINWTPAKEACKGSIAECMGDGEIEMDTENNRRMLATNNYISYGALQRNTVPCSQRGASYYNCKQGAQANPYNRGCSAITRCRS